MSTDAGEPTPPAELRGKLRAAADRLLAGTPLHSDGKLTILSLAREAQVKRWLLTHKYPNQLKDKYQAEFQAVRHKPAPVRAADREIAALREQLADTRADNQRLTDLNRVYAGIINQLAEDLETVTAERDALTSATDITRLRRPRRGIRSQPGRQPTG